MPSRKFGLNLVVLVALAALLTGVWALYNRPVSAPDWPESISGFSFSPFRLDQSPQSGRFPSDEEIRSDLELVSRMTENIRTYSTKGSLSDIPFLAEEYGMRVSLGIWISADEAENEAEIARGIEIANRSRSVVRVIVGNEALFRREVTKDQLIGYLDRVRAAVKVPVTTAEQWHIYEKYPELAKHVDLIAAHVLPYWEFVPMQDSVQFVLDRARDLRLKFPKKPLLLAEVGWPSNGRMRGGATATQADQAIYLRELTNALNKKGYNYFVVEAFDQPWKYTDEGSVGAYWGVFNAARQPKFNFQGPVVAIPKWRVLAIASVVLALLTFTLLLIDSSALRQRGRTFLAVVSFVCASILVWIGYDYSQQYSTWFSITVGVLLGIGALGVVIVLFTEAHELAEAVWTRKRRRLFLPVTDAEAYRPKVSIHVPCYNEPPEMLKETLNALARLDYPDFEVLVIDNNTKDPAVWEPVQAHCELLGPRFRFFHVAPLAGFKGGALNYALQFVAPDAEVIAVIDSDYCVEPDWLKHMVPHFADPQIAVVQSPQDYRDQHESAFKRLCYAEYKGFFHIGMVTRNDRDAIIEHGTMTMVRRQVLDELKWAEWCITEDAELGLRVFERGLSAAYFERSYGKGLMPDTFIDFKKQRFRWAYGAIQIMKRHTDALLRGRGPDGSKLTGGQRYHFVAGWLPWIADGMNIFFTLGALLWSAAMIIVPKRVDPPLLIFAILPLTLFAFKVGKILFLYRRTVGVNLRDALFAALAGLSLSHTIAKAVLYGFVTRSIPFFRTPKMRSSHGLLVALAEAREEVFIMLLLWGAALGIVLVQGVPSPDLMFWVVMLLVQSLPYLAALIMALLSSLPRPREEEALSGSEQVG
ncbi:glycosyltransferase [Pseudomonas citronellolis]|uniref:glycosyltransferase n=1 Tax=Pseudomonas citronellolis TaxID=53408 RepID=UPI0020A0D6FB|nr:glycosyltransferase [Pseudomonas citronellolis]MCP1641877.1 exo-beta-1,3-glucanase (GH17 family)/cellulose synthase/poly-beta-1,6-N-acetylglucosamine synthase-like glycosyltransferase [Pseudomonas citronellolis]MCP1664795.1 exo-beta-1,3-glucanase (GH17 family)/cellulose synthase/poly-beta-1,6-N-acetylglucosamine synthase-like glycosyltransferase [Pseudomonas citronellolis]MCP1695746.1 exo-beta-1,3-glucanase (GH17 family)/cellulose synthase/poly-beta-1,6-N-acetylglucosamine synthase-like glyco